MMQCTSDTPQHRLYLSPREDALYCDVDPDRQGVLLREAKASDDVSASVDYVATDEDGKIVGYFKWVPTT